MAEMNTPEKQTGKKIRHTKLIRVDMTPMVDLGFLLITFFMFTTNFTKPNVMDFALPEIPAENPNKIDTKNSITFIIGKNDRVFYYQEELKNLNKNSLKEVSFSNSGIESAIETARKNAPKPDIFTVIIKPTDDANYKNFVDMLDEMSITNSDKYGLSTLKDAEKKVYEEKIN